MGMRCYGVSLLSPYFIWATSPSFALRYLASGDELLPASPIILRPTIATMHQRGRAGAKMDELSNRTENGQ